MRARERCGDLADTPAQQCEQAKYRCRPGKEAPRQQRVLGSQQRQRDDCGQSAADQQQRLRIAGERRDARAHQRHGGEMARAQQRGGGEDQRHQHAIGKREQQRTGIDHDPARYGQ